MSQVHVIVMTKFPEEGKVKTRLIPALGAAGACAIHDKMASYCIQNMRKLASTSASIELKVHVAGGEDTLVSHWLGGTDFTRQVDGDLGEKIKHAADHSFSSGAQKVIIIGTDCPTIDSKAISEVVQSLDEHDACFIPAYDGGYVLVGIAGEYYGIFDDVSWGSETVMAESLAKVNEYDLSCSILDKKHDVDLEEDFIHLEGIVT